MYISKTLSKNWNFQSPVILSIGNFDGVHLGHQLILSQLKELAKQQNGCSAVLTFSNHPSTILNPLQQVPLLCTIDHKIHLLEKENIDFLIIIPFTKEFSQQPANIFLQTIRKTIPFTTLMLGSDATIGKNREGNRSTIENLAKEMSFNIVYLSDLIEDGKRISSSQIRELIQKGNLEKAQDFLGRPYSIYAPVIKGNRRGTTIGFPTANIDVIGLCLPPLGVYAVSILYEEKTYEGIANLGIAPTIRTTNSPILEVHLFDSTINLYEEFVDVQFLSYIRPEQCFNSLEDLKIQIAKDILAAKEIHNNRSLT